MSRSANHFFTGAGASGPANYIEDVFSTFLYTGTDGAQTITNGIDLSTNGGLVWGKSRSGTQNHRLYDTARGSSFSLISNATSAQSNQGTNACAFNTNGFSLSAASGIVGSSGFGGPNYVSWTFRKQKKFFDVQTFTYPSSGSITINHNLESTPGCVMVKVTDGADNWYVYHRMANNGTNPSNYILQLNTTSAQINNYASWITVGSTSITFPSGALNPGSNFVMYLFAHDAGGFGLTGTDNVISCGSYVGDDTTNGTKKITLGYEPQFLIVKPVTTAPSGFNSWNILDIMRGIPTGGNDPTLIANGSGSEDTTNNLYSVEADGFRHTYPGTAGNDNGITYIYIAIRRGPMKVPTSGTSVYKAITRTGTAATVSVTGVGFAPDLAMFQHRGATNGNILFDRLRGSNQSLFTSQTTAETAETGALNSYDMDGVTLGDNSSGNRTNWNTFQYINHFFRRAPSFFDEVCYTGTGSTLVLNHNLTVAPELIIGKRRTGGSYWILGGNFGATTYSQKNDWGANDSAISSLYSGNLSFGARPTSTTVTLDTNSALNVATYNGVLWMWATCAGVSKVGTYTGTGTTLQIDCGFTAGARFVLITRIGVVGTNDTFIWDSVRGIISGNDPYVLWNSTAAEVTNTDYIDSYSPGFELSSTAPAAINANGGTYIFLAIA